MRPGTPAFLVIDFDHDSRFLLVKTLRRHFPGAIVHECNEAQPALSYLHDRPVTAIVIHQARDAAPLELIRRLHEIEPAVPIVMVSDTETAQAGHEAGACSFLHLDDWPRTGEAVRLALRAAAKSGTAANHGAAR